MTESCVNFKNQDLAEVLMLRDVHLQQGLGYLSVELNNGCSAYDIGKRENIYFPCRISLLPRVHHENNFMDCRHHLSNWLTRCFRRFQLDILIRMS